MNVNHENNIAYNTGYDAYCNGEQLDANPYPFIDIDEETSHRLFCAGWYDAQDDYMCASHEGYY